MIDIHNHLLPRIDDGPSDMEGSLEIIRLAASEGITDIICTPHFDSTMDIDAFRESVRIAIEELRPASLAFGVKLHRGCEMRFSSDKLDMDAIRRCITLADSRYLLMELPFSHMTYNIEETMFNLQIAGLRPILAHPERYRYFDQLYEVLPKLVERGILIQLNASSLTGEDRARQKICEMLISEGIAHFIASDIHTAYVPGDVRESGRNSVKFSGKDTDPNTYTGLIDRISNSLKGDISGSIGRIMRSIGVAKAETRCRMLAGARSKVVRKFGSDTADLLFSTNPSKIISNEQLD